ncbi:porin [Minwuia sp.]|uniref:porin n=1 Tax=Minwuia sp. TaxID=2493630 RepID=UPI003A8FB251
MNHKHLLAGVAAAAIMASGNAFAAAHASVEDAVKANAAAIDALSKEVEALQAGSDGIQKGVKGVNLKLSGHVNRAVMFASDANDVSFFQFVDNDASSTRITFDADTKASSGMTVGARIELQIESNSNIATANPNSITADGDAENLRHAYVFVQGGFGTLTTGQQGEATEGILHNSFNFASLADINPEHTNGAAIAGGGFLAFGDGGRQDSIRYDTPNFGGMKASISARDNGDVTAALRYRGKIGGIGLLAGVGYEGNGGNDNIAGSMGLNFGVIALNGAIAVELADGAAENDAMYYVGLAHKGNYSSLGATSIGVDYLNVVRDDITGANGVVLTAAGALNNNSIGLGLVQGLAPGADAYASVRHFFGSEAIDSAQAAMVGMRVKF